jgi:glycosyltransferase involved in cell wall biosynthesis
MAAGFDDIQFHGTYTPDQVGTILQNIDVVIVPSVWYEVFGIVVLESALYGKPVIASDLGGLAENVRAQQAGWLFPTGDVEALAALLQRCRDEEGFIQSQALRIIKPKTMHTEVLEILQQYQECIQRNVSKMNLHT